MKKTNGFISSLLATILVCMLISPAAFAKQIWQNRPATEYDGLGSNIINNCVLFARYKVPSLPYGLISYSSKQNICNSNTAIAGEIAVLQSYYPTTYGHVAYVESVDGSNITILEGGANTGHINRRTGTESQLEIYGYFNPGNLPTQSGTNGGSSSSAAAYTAYVVNTNGNLAINSAPNAYSQIGVIPEGASCTVYPDRTSGNWYWVTYNGVSGYSYSKYLNPNPQPAPQPQPQPQPSGNTWTGVIRGTDGNLAINSSPNAYSQVGVIPEGASCTVYPDRTSGNWYWVEYNGISGYSYKAYIIQGSTGGSSINTRTGVIHGTDGNLAINSAPNAYSQVGVIPEGASCTVYPDRTSGNWYWVEYNGVSGYSYKAYIALQ